MNKQRIAFLVLAHNAPTHFRALLAALRHPDHISFVHVDRKSDIRPFLPAASETDIFLNQRIPVYWGDFSQVRATILLMQAAIEADPAFDRFVLVSGSDYPLYPATQVNQYLTEHEGAEFIQLSPMPWADGTKPLSRLTDYGVNGRAGVVFRKLAYRAGHPVHIPMGRDYRRRLGDMRPHAGSQWWALSRVAVQHVLDFVHTNSAIRRFFQNAVCPDEMFFHTILAHSTFARTAHRELVFADWSAGGISPAFLTQAHIPYLLSKPSHPATDEQPGSRILFARKFKDQSAELIGAIARGWQSRVG